MRRGCDDAIREYGGGEVGCLGAVVLMSLATMMALWFVYLVAGVLKDVGVM